MRITSFLAPLAMVGALLSAGSVTAPAQAAVIVKPVTTGYAQLVIDAPVGVQTDWLSAASPGRNTSQGLIFPIDTVSLDGTTISLKGAMIVRSPSTADGRVAVSLSLDKARRNMNVAWSLGNQIAYPFFSTRMKVTTTVTANKAKKTRTTTTIWVGDLRLHSGAAADSEFADNLNRAYGVTSFLPGMRLGQIALKTSVTVACKNAACTR